MARKIGCQRRQPTAAASGGSQRQQHHKVGTLRAFNVQLMLSFS
jgi:hypothetical protein